jgi:hypothetical protein
VSIVSGTQGKWEKHALIKSFMATDPLRLGAIDAMSTLPFDDSARQDPVARQKKLIEDANNIATDNQGMTNMNANAFSVNFGYERTVKAMLEDDRKRKKDAERDELQRIMEALEDWNSEKVTFGGMKMRRDDMIKGAKLAMLEESADEAIKNGSIRSDQKDEYMRTAREIVDLDNEAKRYLKRGQKVPPELQRKIDEVKDSPMGQVIGRETAEMYRKGLLDSRYENRFARSLERTFGYEIRDRSNSQQGAEERHGRLSALDDENGIKTNIRLSRQFAHAHDNTLASSPATAEPQHDRNRNITPAIDMD